MSTPSRVVIVLLILAPSVELEESSFEISVCRLRFVVVDTAHARSASEWLHLRRMGSRHRPGARTVNEWASRSGCPDGSPPDPPKYRGRQACTRRLATVSLERRSKCFRHLPTWHVQPRGGRVHLRSPSSPRRGHRSAR